MNLTINFDSNAPEIGLMKLRIVSSCMELTNDLFAFQIYIGLYQFKLLLMQEGLNNNVMNFV